MTLKTKGVNFTLSSQFTQQQSITEPFSLKAIPGYLGSGQRMQSATSSSVVEPDILHP